MSRSKVVKNAKEPTKACCAELSTFGLRSGLLLAVKISSCAIIAMNFSGWLFDVEDLGIKQIKLDFGLILILSTVWIVNREVILELNLNSDMHCSI